LRLLPQQNRVEQVVSEIRAALVTQAVPRLFSLGLDYLLYQGIPMNCPYCHSLVTTQLANTTSLGYRTFRCSDCQRKFNERTGSVYNHLQFPTDVVLLVVLWRLRYKLSLRDLAEMFLVRGFEFTHEAVRDWEARFASLITEQLRARRRGKAGRSWHVDETYVKVGGKWCYLYRATDRDGNLVDSMLSEHRDMEAAKRFFAQAKLVVGHAPEKVTTDGHDAYPRAIRRVLGRKVVHRTSRYLNNRLEQDHRGVKQRYYPMRGFGSFESASRFCQAFDEQRDYFRYRSRPKQKVSLVEQRRMFRQRFGALQYLLMAA
jgi:putative transposase